MLNTAALERPWARFDDLQAGAALKFAPPVRLLSATSPAEVPDLLNDVDKATRAGRWAFGYLCYEAAQGLAHPRCTHPGRTDLPLAWFALTDAPRRVPVIGNSPRRYRAGGWRWDMNAAQHRRAVGMIHDQIAAGAVYQANLTTMLTNRMRGATTDFYGDLVAAQHSAYNALIDTGRHVIASASPELFFEIRGAQITTRPMKGTAARGTTVEQDRIHADALAASIKDRAENIMIVDLMRNDLASIARTGTITVTDLCRVETYPTVHQLTSQIQASVRADARLVDVFAALFPSGSITGAPKAAAMTLLRRLEARPRGVYCGAVGYLAPPTEPVTARFNVAIRTAVIDRAAATVHYGVGGAITWDSDPDSEYAELHTKARLLTATKDPRPKGHRNDDQHRSPGTSPGDPDCPSRHRGTRVSSHSGG
jgi:para-aminobenzoate synthetase/4-amino-4-deoxychorismate lyase